MTAGPITDSTFNLQSLSEEDRAAAERRHAELLRGQEDLLRSNQQLMAAVGREKGVPHAALQALLARMGEAGVPEAAVEARLRAKADEYVSLRSELARPPGGGGARPEAAAARARAQALLDAGDLDGARAVLAEGRGRLRARREETAREEAGLAAEEARVARLGLRYREAAALYAEAAGLVASFDPQAAWARTLDAAGALYAQGSEFGDNAALLEAIATYGKALALTPRAGRPLDWAATQNNLGLALWSLGEREGGPARLEQAVAAFRAALQERTRQRVPLDWAATQSSLGIALWTLGERESSTARLQEAVAALRAALEERTRGRAPLEWAMTQNDLGTALQALGSARPARRGWKRQRPRTVPPWRNAPANARRSTGR